MSDDTKANITIPADVAPANGTLNGSAEPAQSLEAKPIDAPSNGAPITQEKDSAVALPAGSPAPWTLKCEAYGIPFKLKPGKLPPGLYHPLDTPPEGPGNDDFQGVCAT